MRQIFKDRKVSTSPDRQYGRNPKFFDMVPEKSLVQKGQKLVTIPTVVLTVAADGFILRPMIIFRGKTNQTIKNIEAPVIVTQEKAWMGKSLMFICFDQVWKSYGEKKQKELDFSKSLMVYDAFKAHTTDGFKVVLSINIALILSWCLLVVLRNVNH